MKKLLGILFAFMMSLGSAFAAELMDVPTDYWASKEIIYCIREGIIKPVSADSFMPELQVKRAEFNSMLLRTLGHRTVDVTGDGKKFSDVNAGYWGYEDILKSERLGLLYGYPDNTFKPDEEIIKAEVASIISHITKDAVTDVNILNQFADKDDIPSWAVNQFAKSVEIGIYVNYPDLAYLLPNKVLNRAEAAVILYKLRMAMGMVQEQYVAKEYVIGTEHLNIYPEASNHKVTVTNYRKIIQAGNVLSVNFAEKYNSKRSAEGNDVKFVFPKDVVTQEGSVLIPQGSIATASVATLQPQRALNKNAKVTLKFNSITLPSGETIPISGKVLDNDGILTASKLATFGKVAGYTLGSMAVGTGASIGIAGMAHPHNFGTAVAIGLPVSAGVGIVTGLLTPGLAYKANTNDSLYVELEQDVVLNEAL